MDEMLPKFGPRPRNVEFDYEVQIHKQTFTFYLKVDSITWVIKVAPI